MKNICIALSFLAQIPTAFANWEEVIHFSANIQNEDLAEEGIELLECLSTKAELPWELQNGIRGTHWLYLEQLKGSSEVKGQAKIREKQHSFSLRPGGAREICQAILPSPPVLTPEIPPVLEVTSEPKSGNTKYWVIGGLIAAAITGFVIWRRSSQPMHRSIEMR